MTTPFNASSPKFSGTKATDMDEAPRNPKLRIRDLWKVYGLDAKSFVPSRGHPPTEAELEDKKSFAAVKGVSFDVWPGELITVMGLSGSGKSTMLRTASRLIEPSYGQVMIDDEDLLAASPKRLIELRRHRIGMVFQNYALLPHRTVLENVALPLEVRGDGRAEREERARQMIELVGLKDRMGHLPAQLSGGQQQRVGIARSLAIDPDIWFLDEPFSALDPLIRNELQEELLRLQAIVKKTILFVTHDFDEAVRLANRIVIMEGGRIAQIGTPEEIVLNPQNKHVADFVRHVRRAAVVSIGSLATPAFEPAATCVSMLPAKSKVIAVADKIIGASGVVGVVDERGAIVGTITADAILPILLDRS